MDEDTVLVENVVIWSVGKEVGNADQLKLLDPKFQINQLHFCYSGPLFCNGYVD